MLKQMFVLCFGSEITHQSRCPQQVTCFPFAFSLVGREVAHPHPISVSEFPFWETLAASQRENRAGVGRRGEELG